MWSMYEALSLEQDIHNGFLTQTQNTNIQLLSEKVENPRLTLINKM